MTMEIQWLDTYQLQWQSIFSSSYYFVQLLNRSISYRLSAAIWHTVEKDSKLNKMIFNVGSRKTKSNDWPPHVLVLGGCSSKNRLSRLLKRWARTSTPKINKPKFETVNMRDIFGHNMFKSNPISKHVHTTWNQIRPPYHVFDYGPSLGINLGFDLNPFDK